jgi:prohibitin 2
LLGKALSINPAFLELRRVDAAKEIASLMAKSRNKIYLESDTLMMNLTGKFDENLEKNTVSASDKARDRKP